MSETKHTPKPWIYLSPEQTGGRAQIRNYGTIVAYPITEANARHIVHCVNVHDDLLARLTDLLEWLDANGLSHTQIGGCDPFTYGGDEYSVVANARAAIAKATEPQEVNP